MPRRKNKSASAPAPAQSSEVLNQLEFDSFISMDLPVRPTFAICHDNIRNSQSGTTGGKYTPDTPDPPANTTTAYTNPTACTKGNTDAPIPIPVPIACTKGNIDAPIPNRKENGTPTDEPVPTMHTVPQPPHPPQHLPFSNSPRLSSTPTSSSREESWATNLRQQDPASSPPRSIQARSPLLALQPAGGHNNAARSIFVGDQAWPPIRPPIQQSPAGTRDTGLSQVAPDIGVEAQRARNAFREPQDSRPPEETLAAASSCFASLMARVRPATQSRLTTTSTRPLAPAPSETAGLIVSAGFQDPEASVAKCEVNIRPAPSRLPRTISRAEMNRRWRLNDPPVRSRILQAADETGGSSGAVASAPPARPAALPAAVGSGSEELIRHMEEPDPAGVKPGGKDHGRCAQVTTCVAHVAPQGGTASTDSGPVTTTKEAAPWYNQPDAQGKGEDGVGKVSISQCNSMIGNSKRSTAPLLTEGLADNFGKEGPITDERGVEGASSETPPSYGTDPTAARTDERELPHVDSRGSAQVLPRELDSSVDAWRVTADVVVQTDGTPIRMLSCTVDTQWHETTVRTLPLHGSLWAGLSLTDGERLVRLLRIVTGEEAIRCLGGARELWSLDTQKPTRVLCVATRESSLHHLWCTAGLNGACIETLKASRFVNSPRCQVPAGGAWDSVLPGEPDTSDMSSDDTAWRVTADLIVRTDGTLVRTLNHTLDTQWRGTIVRTLPQRNSLLAGLSLTDDERLIRVLRVAPREEAIHCLLGAQGLWPVDNQQQARVLSVASWQDSLRHLRIVEGLDEECIRNLRASRLVNCSGQATEYVARVRTDDSSMDHRELPRWTALPALGLPRLHAAFRTVTAARLTESETSSGDPPAGPDNRQEHPSLAMPESGGGTDKRDECGERGEPEPRRGQSSTTRASLARAGESTLGRSSPAAAAPSSAQYNTKGTRAGWTLSDYIGGVRPQARTPPPPPVDPRAWRLAVLAEGTKSEQLPLASVRQKLRQRRMDRQNSTASVQPPDPQEQEQFHTPRRARRPRPPPQPQPTPTHNPFEALAGLSEDAPAQGRQSQRTFQAPRRAALLSDRQEFCGPSDRLARQAPKGWKARSKSTRGAGSDLLNMTADGPVTTRIPLGDTLRREDKLQRAHLERRMSGGRRGAARVVCAQRQTSDGNGMVLPVTRPATTAQIEVELRYEQEFAGEGDLGAHLRPAAGRPRVWAGMGMAERRGSSCTDKHFILPATTGWPASAGGGTEGRGQRVDADHLHARPTTWPWATPTAQLEEKASRTPLASGTDNPGFTHHRSGTAPIDMPQEEHRSSVTVRVREGLAWHEINIAQTDWQVLQHSRFGASPDLIVSLRLRESLNRSDLDRLALLTAEALTLDRHSWPSSWEDFVSSVDQGTHFRVESREKGGMDPARQTELANMQFPADLDWPLLDQGYLLVRRQEALPEAYPPVYRKRAELLAEATQLYQWERMASLPEGNNHGECTPARMAALLVLLARKQGGRDRTPPPWVNEGAEGQIIELRFNSVPPPADLPTGGGPTDSLKDWLLIRLVRSFPALGTTLSRTDGNGVDYRWVRSKIRIDGDLDALQEFSMTAILPYGPWVGDLVSRRVSIEGSYCTVAPFGTHIEVPLSPEDNTIFRCVRLSLGLNSSDSLDLLEDGFSRAIPEAFISCRFTTVLSTASGGKGRRRTFSHFPPEDERAATLFTIGAENLLMARRRQLQVALRLGVDGQYPVTLKVMLPPPPQRVLHMMLESLGTPPLRLRVRGALFASDRVLLGPLPAGWLTGKVDFYSEVAQENLRREIATLCHAHLNTEGLQFVGRREPAKNRRTRSDLSPLFIYLEFPGVDEARVFGTKADEGSLPREFLAFWEAYVGTQPTVWSSMVLLEALEIVAPDKWAPLMERGEHSPCPLPPPPV